MHLPAKKQTEDVQESNIGKMHSSAATRSTEENTGVRGHVATTFARTDLKRGRATQIRTMRDETYDRRRAQSGKGDVSVFDQNLSLQPRS